MKKSIFGLFLVLFSGTAFADMYRDPVSVVLVCKARGGQGELMIHQTGKHMGAVIGYNDELFPVGAPVTANTEGGEPRLSINAEVNFVTFNVIVSGPELTKAFDKGGPVDSKKLTALISVNGNEPYRAKCMGQISF